jgi:hypothetical protein
MQTQLHACHLCMCRAHIGVVRNSAMFCHILFANGLLTYDTNPLRCRNLLLGDGGYINATMETLGGERGAKQATMFPTMFDSKNWEAFRDHAFRVGCSAAVP